MGKTAKKIVAGAVVVVAVAVVIWIVTSSEDEAPIRVKNGSMTIETAGTWQEDGGAWSNDTGKQHHQNELWVRVDLADGTTCTGSGHPVQIEYSVAGFKAIFNPAGNPPRTKVSPRAGLDRETNQRLRHGTSGDGGYITAVRINGTLLTCNITQNNLSVINICSSAAACQ